MPRVVAVGFVRVPVDALTPVLEMRFCGIHRSAEAVYQFWSALWHTQELGYVVMAKLDLPLPKLLLRCRCEFRASLAQDAIRAMRRVHPDAVIVIA